MAACFLLLLFAFIFIGVSAFSTADGFSAVINSILPAAAGLSMGAQKKENSKIFRQLSKSSLKDRINDKQDHQVDEDCVTEG